MSLSLPDPTQEFRMFRDIHSKMLHLSPAHTLKAPLKRTRMAQSQQKRMNLKVRSSQLSRARDLQTAESATGVVIPFKVVLVVQKVTNFIHTKIEIAKGMMSSLLFQRLKSQYFKTRELARSLLGV
jgi:hypothetical protein